MSYSVKRDIHHSKSLVLMTVTAWLWVLEDVLYAGLFEYNQSFVGLTLATMYTAEKLFSCQTGLSRLPTISFCAFADVTTDRPSFLTLLLTYMGMRRNFVVEYGIFSKQCRIRNFGYFVTADFPLGMRNCKATKFRPSYPPINRVA
jgi:hypothetical protein